MPERRRRFAEGTSVPVGRSREEIDRLLRGWGVDGIRWTDEFTSGRIRLEFNWRPDDADEVVYQARFDVLLPDDTELANEARHATSGNVLPAKLAKLKEANGRREMRALLAMLRGAFEAIEDGIIDAERFFLPWLVGKDGRTFADAALPQMAKLLTGPSTALLPAPEVTN